MARNSCGVIGLLEQWLMRLSILAIYLLSFSAYSAPLLNSGDAYPVRKEWKEPGSTPKALQDFYSEMEMDFESYDPNDASGEPLMSTHTNQRMKMRKLPKLDTKDPATPKDGLVERTELTFEKLVNSSKVRVPGMKKPFETRSDLGVLLGAHPLIIRGDGKNTRKVDDLDAIRNQVLQQAGDPVSRASISTLLSESILLRAGASAGQDSSCLSQLGGKKPGDKWKFSREEQGAKFEYDCSFEGWAEVQGKKVAVVKLHSGKQRVLRQQPNGVPGMAETEGDGVIYFEPNSQESLMRMETKITVEPADEEMGRLKAKGQVIPRNRSVMKHSNHNYGL